MNAGNRNRHWWHGFVLCALLWQPGIAVAEGRFTFSLDGTQVTDSQTGLTWRRCSEGQAFSAGTCSGSASVFTREAALAHARTQSGWRLPNIKELSSIVDTRRSNPSVDADAFPATPARHFWSSSPYAGNSYNAWLVHFSGGTVVADNRHDDSHVRLVR